MSGDAPTTHVLRFADLPTDTGADFMLAPDADARAALAAELGILALRKLRFAGRVVPQGTRDWALQAKLGATVVQPCVVTLDPVTTRIDEPVTRTYLANPPPVPDAEEVEMPEDDSVEPLPDTIDLREVMAEALALALPAFPRADGAELGQATALPAGTTEADLAKEKPFAGLAALRDKIAPPDEG